MGSVVLEQVCGRCSTGAGVPVSAVLEQVCGQCSTGAGVWSVQYWSRCVVSAVLEQVCGQCSTGAGVWSVSTNLKAVYGNASEEGETFH